MANFNNASYTFRALFQTSISNRLKVIEQTFVTVQQNFEKESSDRNDELLKRLEKELETFRELSGIVSDLTLAQKFADRDRQVLFNDVQNLMTQSTENLNAFEQSLNQTDLLEQLGELANETDELKSLIESLSSVADAQEKLQNNQTELQERLSIEKDKLVQLQSEIDEDF